MSLQEKIDSQKALFEMLKDAGLTDQSAVVRSQIEELERELRGEKPKAKPKPKEEAKPKPKATAEPKPKKKKKFKIVEKTEPKKTKIVVKRERGRPIKDTGAKAELLRSLGATEANIKKEREVEVEVKPKNPIGRPKKINLKGLIGDELLKAIEENTRQAEERNKLLEERRKQAYEARLKKMREQRATTAKPRGRPRKEAEPKKERPKTTRTELNASDIKKLYSKYRYSALGYKLDNIREWTKTQKENKKLQGGADKALIPVIEDILIENSNLTSQELKTTYNQAKSQYENIFTYPVWLDAIVFSLYLYKSELGQRITRATESKTMRKDTREAYPEYAQAFVKDDYQPSKIDFWVVFGYYRLKTGNWNKSFEMLSRVKN